MTGLTQVQLDDVHRTLDGNVREAVEGLVDAIEQSGVVWRIGLPDSDDEQNNRSVNLVLAALLDRARSMVAGEVPETCPCGSGRAPFNVADPGEPAEWRCPGCSP